MNRENTKLNNKGFTLIELLAVIVILGVILAIAVPTVSGYISKSKKDAWINSAMRFIQDVRNRALAGTYSLPTELDEVTIVSLNMVPLESGKFESSFGNKYVDRKSYVIIVNYNTALEPKYHYYFAAQDERGNYIPLTLEEKLDSSKVFANARDTAPVSIQSLFGTPTGTSKNLFCDDGNTDCSWDSGTPKSYIVGLKLPVGYTQWMATIYSKN